MNTRNSEKLFRRARNVLVGGVNSPVRSFAAVGGSPLFVSRAEGPYVYDADGNRFIDYVASWGPLILGHSHPSVVSAVEKRLPLGTSYGAPCELETDLAALIARNFPSIEKIRMTNSGTEATMSAIRLARATTGREYIVKFEGCYHGHSDFLLVKSGSGATTFGNPSSAGVPKSFVNRTLLARYNDIDSVAKLFAKYPKKIAGVIIEPVAGNMGVVTPGKNFLRRLRSVCKKHGALLIFDEVITGFRLARGGAQSLFGVTPDITCLGKIIGGGLPVGAYGASGKIMGMVSPEGPMYQAGTLSGNPLAMAAGLATVKELNAKNYRRLESLTDSLVSGIRETVAELGIAATVNSVGSMFTVFFTGDRVTDYSGALRCDTERYARFFRNLLQNGVMFPPSQFESVFVSTAHTKKEIDQTLQAIRASLLEISQGEKNQKS
ncbi:MAG: glutamate-1-semialdehyde-2,1-aminomutase [Candidatus Dadabacteria bacterium]|nr:glutamate-1-semialdehyde-2,1-aminomutase [Candidatus Dadabacteria bacterium]MYA47941.1 glutamate-1-semialdehyde-2,1-aminomutase [Candidatus Dadabacteria bacterium]MYG82871.1 glutamate-1-semialdehyde-2,1-aminomutase [Candidatus Dadabacteria bacterium]MYK49189.1 glutamate-1-semialdehyde-2,1-aminomutase [Candidatus Dadabacteria bacterium]